MLPEALLQYTLRGDDLIPRYLGAHDHPWIRSVVDLYVACAGQPRRELDARLAPPLDPTVPVGPRLMVLAMLDRLTSGSPRAGTSGVGEARSKPAAAAAVPPGEVRKRLVLAAQQARDAGAYDRARVIATVADPLGVTPEEIDVLLQADLPSERPLGTAPFALDPVEIALRTNLALVQGLVQRASWVRVVVTGNARAVVRVAQLQRLLCTVHPAGPARVRLELSGPYALFRRTTLYGRALASILPFLPWCEHFALTAECTVRGRSARLRVAHGDPIRPATAPRQYDSALEARFVRSFVRHTERWDLIREPEPLVAGDALIYPDFAARWRSDPTRVWYIEIVGFWTAEYLERKLQRFSVARVSNLILVVDEARDCDARELPEHVHLLRFKRSVDARAVLAVMEAGDEEAPDSAAPVRPGA